MASTPSLAWPLSIFRPNLESVFPVVINSWVWASTPGVTLSRAFALLPICPPILSILSTSARLSTTKQPIFFSKA